MYDLYVCVCTNVATLAEFSKAQDILFWEIFFPPGNDCSRYPAIPNGHYMTWSLSNWDVTLCQFVSSINELDNLRNL